MAGVIKIREGKIIYVSNDSGHYQPDGLDMYRAIKVIQEKMPNTFSVGATIDVYGTEYPVEMFIAIMERIDVNGKPLHQNLRDRRIVELKNYKDKLPTLDSVDKSDMYKPIHRAALRGDIDSIKKYIKNGVEIDTPDEIGSTALYYAVAEGREKLIYELLKLGANPNAVEDFHLVELRPEFFTKEKITTLYNQCVRDGDEVAKNNLKNTFPDFNLNISQDLAAAVQRSDVQEVVINLRASEVAVSQKNDEGKRKSPVSIVRSVTPTDQVLLCTDKKRSISETGKVHSVPNKDRKADSKVR